MRAASKRYGAENGEPRRSGICSRALPNVGTPPTNNTDRFVGPEAPIRNALSEAGFRSPSITCPHETKGLIGLANRGSTEAARSLLNAAADYLDMGLPVPKPLSEFLAEGIRHDDPTRALRLVKKRGQKENYNPSDERKISTYAVELVSELQGMGIPLRDKKDEEGKVIKDEEGHDLLGAYTIAANILIKAGIKGSKSPARRRAITPSVVEGYWQGRRRP